MADVQSLCEFTFLRLAQWLGPGANYHVDKRESNRPRGLIGFSSGAIPEMENKLDFALATHHSYPCSCGTVRIGIPD